MNDSNAPSTHTAPPDPSPGSGSVPAPHLDFTDRYDVMAQIGRGGMGLIVSAFDQDVRREVAIKTLISSADDNAVGRFVQEGQVTGQLEHPNIVPVHDVAVSPDGHFYFTMKRVRGGSLHHLIGEAREAVRAGQPVRLSLARRIDIFRKVLDAVEYAHSRGVIHRDLKPANIMVGEFGEVLVMDWGLARILRQTDDEGDGEAPRIRPMRPMRQDGGPDTGLISTMRNTVGSMDPVRGAVHPTAAPDESSRQPPVSSDRVDDDLEPTLPGQVMGTPGYMAVEQARGNPDQVDGRCDIYALGAILYELLTCTRAYSGSPAECLVQQLEGPPEPAAQRVAREFGANRHLLDTPRELSQIARACLLVRAADRYQTIAEVREDLEAYLNHELVSVAPDPLQQRFVKWVRRRPTLAAVTGTAAVFAAVASLVLVLMFAREARQQSARELAEYRAATADARAAAEAAARERAEADSRAATARAEAEASARERAELETMAKEGRLAEVARRLIGYKRDEAQRVVNELYQRWGIAEQRGLKNDQFFDSLSAREVSSYIESLEGLVRDSEEFGEVFHTAGQLVMLGLLYHTRRPGEEDTALKWYTAAIELDPQHWSAWVNRGLMRQYTGDPEGALEDYRAANRIRPGAGGAPRGIAELQDYFALVERIRADPQDVDALVERAIYHRDHRQPENALADCSAAIAAREDARAYYIRAQIHEKASRYPEAEADFRRAAELRNSNEYWVALANHLRMRPEPDAEAAVEAASRALELKPDDWRAFVNRGYAHNYLGHSRLALADLEAAMRLCPDAGWRRRLREHIDLIRDE